MNVRTQAGGIMTPPEQRTEVDSTVITTDEGDPIVVAVNLDGVVCVATINDPNFEEYMGMLGYDKSRLPKNEPLKV